MRAEPKVSVCIPTRNRAHWLADAIGSVLAQRFNDLEVVVSDNASDDRTQEVLASFDDPRVVHSRTDRMLSITENWNRAFAMARGRYLTLLPDDDMMLPDNLSEKVGILDEQPRVGLVHSRYHRIDAKGVVTRENIGKYFLRERLEPLVLPAGEACVKLIENNYVHESTTLFRRECREEVGPFLTTLRFSADWNMWLRIAWHHDIAFCPRPLILWRDHNQSSTQLNIMVNDKPTILLLDDRVLAVTEIERYVAARGGNVRRQAVLRLSRDIYDIGDELMRSGGDGAGVRRAILRAGRKYPELLLQRRALAMLAQSWVGVDALDRVRHALLR